MKFSWAAGCRPRIYLCEAVAPKRLSINMGIIVLTDDDDKFN